MPTVVTATVNPALDRNTSAEHVTSNEKLRCEPPSVEPGGGGINVSRAIGILGGESTTVYTAGGYAGEQLHRLLEADKVRGTRVPVEEATRQHLLVRDQTSGDQYRFGMPGPRLSDSEQRRFLDAVATAVDGADYLIAGGSLPPGVPPDFYSRVARIGHDAGARVIVDTSGPPLLSALEEDLYLIKPNVRELDQIAGTELIDDNQRVEAIRDLTSRGKVQAVVLSQGRGGSLRVTSEGTARFRSPAVAIESRIGAGDSMVAGIVLALVQGSDLEEAVLFGTAAGASAVTTPGTELCRRDSTEKLFHELKSDAEQKK